MKEYFLDLQAWYNVSSKAVDDGILTGEKIALPIIASEVDVFQLFSENKEKFKISRELKIIIDTWYNEFYSAVDYFQSSKRDAGEFYIATPLIIRLTVPVEFLAELSNYIQYGLGNFQIQAGLRRRFEDWIENPRDGVKIYERYLKLGDKYVYEKAFKENIRYVQMLLSDAAKLIDKGEMLSARKNIQDWINHKDNHSYDLNDDGLYQRFREEAFILLANTFPEPKIRSEVYRRCIEEKIHGPRTNRLYRENKKRVDASRILSLRGEYQIQQILEATKQRNYCSFYPISEKELIIVDGSGARLFDYKNKISLWSIQCNNYDHALSEDMSMIIFNDLNQYFVWDLQSSTLRNTLRSDGRRHTGMVVSHDNRYLIFYADRPDYNLRCLELESGKEIWQIHMNCGFDADFILKVNPNGKLVACMDMIEKVIKLYNLE